MFDTQTMNSDLRGTVRNSRFETPTHRAIDFRFAGDMLQCACKLIMEMSDLNGSILERDALSRLANRL